MIVLPRKKKKEYRAPLLWFGVTEEGWTLASRESSIVIDECSSMHSEVTEVTESEVTFKHDSKYFQIESFILMAEPKHIHKY